MKKFLLIVFFICSFKGFSQSKHIEVYCEIYDEYIDYGRLTTYVPDSLKYIFVSRDSFQVYTGNDLLNILSLHGWKLVSTDILPELKSFDFTERKKYHSRFILTRTLVFNADDYLQVLKDAKKDMPEPRKNWDFY
jgi:cobalamin biosynthesis Co2+ chelatase CbiK